MKILFTGNYEAAYNRNLIILEGLQELGAEVTERPANSKKEFIQKNILKEAEDADIIYLPAFTHAWVRFLKKKLPQKPIIFDPLISKYMTKVFDYKNVSRFSPRAIKNYYKDKIAFSHADILIADTIAHKDYFAKKFRISPGKIKVLPIGVSTRHFYPAESQRTNDKIKVGFYGSFAPLQGIEKIIDTAFLMKDRENVRFHIIGSGYDFKKVEAQLNEYQLSNVEFEGWLDYSELNERINDYDICLGIFGETPKTGMVVPNKIFHYMACRKAVVTKDTPAMRELFRDGENIQLSSTDARDIKDKILFLINQKEQRDFIARNAHELIRTHYTQKHIAKKLLQIMYKHLKSY
ncbi:MAG: glycosyltransferase [Bacteroidota bacterium]|nr:glycosyltransferase [Bacteroidota bacterium]